MAILAGISIFLMTIAGIASIDDNHKCGDDIIDYYVRKDAVKKAGSVEFPYTITITCDTCPQYGIGRKHYDLWADEYRKLGMEPPYPERTDTNNIFNNERE